MQMVQLMTAQQAHTTQFLVQLRQISAMIPQLATTLTWLARLTSSQTCALWDIIAQSSQMTV